MHFKYVYIRILRPYIYGLCSLDIYRKPKNQCIVTCSILVESALQSLSYLLYTARIRRAYLRKIPYSESTTIQSQCDPVLGIALHRRDGLLGSMVRGTSGGCQIYAAVLFAEIVEPNPYCCHELKILSHFTKCS